MKMEIIGSRVKRVSRVVSVLVMFSAALTMAQSTAAIGRTNGGEKSGIEKSGTSASKWGPSRNVTEPAGPRAESAASNRALKSAEPKPSEAHAAANQEATSAGHTAGTATAAGGDVAPSKSEHQAFGTFSGKGHASASSGGSNAKKSDIGKRSKKKSLGTRQRSSTGQSHIKAGVHKATNHSTW
jgi:hypothetical protein